MPEDFNEIYIRTYWKKVGDRIEINISLTAITIPSFTTAEWNALTHVYAMMGWDSDILQMRTWSNTHHKIFVLADTTVILIGDSGATPSVAGYHDIDITNTGAQTITNFINGTDGQILRIRFGDNNTTIPHEGVGNFKLTGRANINFITDDMLVLERRGGVWYQIGGII